MYILATLIYIFSTATKVYMLAINLISNGRKNFLKLANGILESGGHILDIKYWIFEYL
jgi:hypothetical protein